MARAGYYTNPWEKKLEVFHDFSGGLNTVSANESMRDNEMTDLVNIELAERGALKRRHGMVKHADNAAQGIFRHYLREGVYVEITASDGKFYVDGENKPIEGLSEGFQTEKQVEAVQFRDKTYFATGTKLVQFDGDGFKVVEPYAPEPLEALYVGTNALADNPNDFMKDGTGTFLRLDGVTFSKRYGVINEDVTLTTYITKPSEMSGVEFQFEYRNPFMEDGFWEIGQDWSSSKTYTHTAILEGDMQFRINAREAGKTVAEVQYIIPKYKVKGAPDSNDDVDSSTIHKCNRILLHWNRVILYGDEYNSDLIYISHLNNPNFFPTPNTLRFENNRNEGITSLVQYRDSIVAFTQTTIQALYGKSPLDYRRVTLNTGIGCIAPYSAVVSKNYIMFLSLEGVHILKSVGYTDDKANVEKIDVKIDNLTTREIDACAAIHDGQYHLTLPQEGRRLRYYLDTGAWSKDESVKLNFKRLYTWDGELYGQSNEAYRFDKDSWTDDGHVYDDIWESRYLTFGQPFHPKKLKEFQVILSPRYGTINAEATIFADSATVATSEESGAFVDAEGNVVWQTEIVPNITAPAGSILGDWKMGENPFGDIDSMRERLRISGKCRTTKVRFKHSEAKQNTVIGFAYVFKIKNP